MGYVVTFIIGMVLGVYIMAVANDAKCEDCIICSCQCDEEKENTK